MPRKAAAQRPTSRQELTRTQLWAQEKRNHAMCARLDKLEQEMFMLLKALRSITEASSR